MAGNHSSQNDHGGHHIVPASALTQVLGALIALTVLTVLTAKFMHLGVLAVPVAFAIAIVKALLVMGYFMGLKYDTLLNKVIFSTAFAGLALLFFFAALDIFSRIPLGSSL